MFIKSSGSCWIAWYEDYKPVVTFNNVVVSCRLLYNKFMMLSDRLQKTTKKNKNIIFIIIIVPCNIVLKYNSAKKYNI